MQKKFISLVGLFAFINCGAALAADSSLSVKGESSVAAETAAPAPKRWKASASSYYYAFEGTRAAHDDLYNFGKASLAMQMVSVSWDVAPGWTILGLGEYMDNYVETNMPIPGVGNVLFKDRTLGWGDTLLDVVHPLYLGSSFLVFGDAGVSLPTGSISKKNPSSPIGGNYAYNMQLGSGTYDLELGALGLYLHKYFQAGTHLSTYQRLGPENQIGRAHV